jgi:hypothetical protein
MKKLIVFAIAILGFTAVSFGQKSATLSVPSSATIIAPLSVTKPADNAAGGALKFGTIVSTTVAGTVTVTTATTPGRSVTGVTAIGTDFDNAKFTVGGQTGQTYNVALDASVSLTGAGGDPMVCTLSKSVNNTGNTLGTFYVGGELAVAANQGAGSYQGTFSVIVSYE